MQSPTGEYTFTDLTKLLYHTVILHSKITPKRPQITLDFPKSMHLGHIFLLRLAKTVFHHYPRLLHKPREPAHTSKGLSVAAFCTKCGKKNISVHNVHSTMALWSKAEIQKKTF